MFGAGETLVKKRKAIDALEAEWLADVAEYDRSGAWQTDGHFGTAAALRHLCHIDQSVAQQYVSVGRRLEKLPGGRGGVRRRRPLVSARAGPRPRLHPQTGRGTRRGRSRVRRRAPRRSRRKCCTGSCAATPTSSTVTAALVATKMISMPAPCTCRKPSAAGGDLRGTIDPLTGELIATAVNAEMARDLQADDPRRMPQRRADALANICRHALEHGELGESHGVRPHLGIVIDVNELPWLGPAPATPTLRPDLRHDLSATSIEFLLCDCDLTRILMRGTSEVLDLGRSTPIASPAQWKALVARDRHCQAPGCRRPPADCQAHHKRHYTRGGPTDLDNLELLCWYHHRQRHIDDNNGRAAWPET